MAIKKKTKKKSSKGKSRKGTFGGIDIMKYLGFAGGIFASEKGFEKMTWFTDLDAKAQAGIKIGIGEFAPRYIKPYAKGNDAIVDGAGTALQVLGMKELMTEFGIAGIGEDVMGDDDLEMELDGLDDIDTDDDDLGEDVMGEDEDLDTVNQDNDLDTVNDDWEY